MQGDHASIYEQLQRPTAQLLEKLMSSDGEAMLDHEILKMKVQMGQESFDEFAQQFFKDTDIDYRTFFSGGQRLHQQLRVMPAPKKQTADQQIIQRTQSSKASVQHNNQQTFLTAAHKQRQQSKSQNKVEEQMQVIQNDPQDCTNNSEQLQNEYEEISKQNLQQNRFRIKYKNGDVYEGEIQEGMKNGWGDYMYQSGQKYSGCFIDDQINGYGRYYFLSGTEYEGDWSSGMKHGIGILKFANKDVYQGSFSNDDLHGKGIYRYHNGDVFEGIFKKGVRHGAGVFTGADGRFQKGQWINDKFEV